MPKTSKKQDKKTKAMFAHLQKKTGLNKMTVQELKHSNGEYYVPPIYQVNVNGKGMQTPSNAELTKQHLENFSDTIESANKSGRKLNR